MDLRSSPTFIPYCRDTVNCSFFFFTVSWKWNVSYLIIFHPHRQGVFACDNPLHQQQNVGFVFLNQTKCYMICRERESANEQTFLCSKEPRWSDLCSQQEGLLRTGCWRFDSSEVGGLAGVRQVFTAGTWASREQEIDRKSLLTWPITPREVRQDGVRREEQEMTRSSGTYCVCSHVSSIIKLAEQGA